MLNFEICLDYAEEKEVHVSDVGNVLANLAQRSNEKSEKSREVTKIKIPKEDIELVMNEMEVSKLKAERTLRECKGNIVEALTVLVNS